MAIRCMQKTPGDALPAAVGGKIFKYRLRELQR